MGGPREGCLTRTKAVLERGHMLALVSAVLLGLSYAD